MRRSLLALSFLLMGAALAAEEPDGKPTVVPAVLRSVSPAGIVRGSQVLLTLEGARISGATGVFFDDPGISGRVLPPTDAKSKDRVTVEASVSSEVRPGIHRVFLQTPLGTTEAVTFAVGAWSEVAEKEPNDARDAAQPVSLPATLVGSLQKQGDVDSFQFEGKAGQEIVVQVLGASIRSKLNAVLTLTDGSGRVLAKANPNGIRAEPLLGHRLEAAGSYLLQVRDFEDKGGAEVSYRINCGEFPVVTGVFPLGLRRGTTAGLTLAGFNLGQRPILPVTAPDTESAGREPALGRSMPLPGEWLSAPRLALGDDPEVEEAEAGGMARTVPVPVTINGRIHTPGGATDVDEFRFAARRGQPLVLEVAARRYGSPLDSVVEVLDARGRPVERATIRPVAETSLVLNGRDSSSSGFRIQSWADLAVNDHVFCGRELLQITRLPGGPDEDVSFRSFRGRRIGLLDTTPEAHALGSSLYKVQVHPPGKSFPPNGMPLFRLYYRNDDGGVLHGKDSRLTFDPPADGEYVARIADVRATQGPEFAYRLSIHPPRPDYQLRMSPGHLDLLRGSRVPVNVEVERFDGFDCPVEVRLEGLPDGFTAEPAVVAAGSFAATLTVSASAEAATPSLPVPSPIRLVGRARIGEREVVRAVEPENGLRLLTVLPEPDVGVTTDVREVTLRPGGEVEVEARVERRHGFKGRVPIDVRNLPFGVQVRDVGLNGVLVTEQQSSRRFVLVAEPWVKPQTRLFYAIGRVESDPGTEISAEPILLKVAPAAAQASR